MDIKNLFNFKHKKNVVKTSAWEQFIALKDILERLQSMKKSEEFQLCEDEICEKLRLLDNIHVSMFREILFKRLALENDTHRLLGERLENEWAGFVISLPKLMALLLSKGYAI